MKAWWLIGGAALVLGCGDPSSRSFAVTILDSPDMLCTGYADGLLADPVALQKLAKETRKTWKKELEANPPTPQARLLRVNELEDRVQAWFDPVPVASRSEDPADHYDNMGAVYEGDLHDDFIEGVFAELFNTDEEDEEASRYLCGYRPSAHGTLTLTTDGFAFGRIRWAHVTYVPSEYSACEGRIECARDITLEGLEVD